MAVAMMLSLALVGCRADRAADRGDAPSASTTTAALDVTDPEPLPAGHPLWDLDNCLITPHTANTWEMAEPLFAERVTANVRRYVAGEPLLGVVDPALGY